MPTILRGGPYRFWLAPVSLAQNQGFRPVELRQVQALVEENRAGFLEAWNDYFGIEQPEPPAAGG